MLTETLDFQIEERILTGLATDSLFCARLLPYWHTKDGLSAEGPFSNSWTNKIGSWCIKHFEKYGEAPKAGLNLYFQRWVATKKRTPKLVEEIEKILVRMSKNFVDGLELNTDQLCDEARNHFISIKLRRMYIAGEADLKEGKVDSALSRALSIYTTEITDDANEDVFLSENEVYATFEGIDESLIQFPPGSGLADFFQSEIARDCFVAIQAPEKTGKTFVLQELGFLAMLQRKRVAFFEVGDMTRRQIKRRLMARVSDHPWRSPTGIWPTIVKFPTSLLKSEKGKVEARVQHTNLNFTTRLDRKTAWESCQKLMRDKVKSNHSFFKLAVYPNVSINVAGIRAKLKSWHLEGWCPDLIIIDYADILASPNNRLDPRDAINETWAQLRRLSEETHACVITATQSDAASYDTITQSKKNFSNDKRKHSHINSMFALNVTPKEKEQGTMRLNWIDARDIDFNYKRCCHVATCLSLANPFVLSVF
jgi:hypothetical protein